MDSRWIIILMVMIIPLCLVGQVNLENHSKFESASLLEEEKITGLIEDIHGFIWITTESSVFRFDGVQLEPIFQGLFEDVFYGPDSMELFFIHRKGVIRYDCNKGHFDKIEVKEISKPGDNLYGGIVYNDSTVIYTRHEGITIHHLRSNRLNNFNPLPPSENVIGILTIAKDIRQPNTVWLGTRRNGLLRYNLETRQVDQKLFEIEEESLYNEVNTITSIVPYNQHLLIGTWHGGFLYYNIETGEYRQYFIQDKRLNDGNISFDRILKIFQYKDDEFWVSSTKGVGLFNATKEELLILDRSDQGHQFYKNTPLYQDSKRRLWVGYDNGLRLLDTLRSQFNVIENPFFTQELWEIPQEVIQDEKTGDLYFCNFMSKGVYKYTAKDKEWKLIRPLIPLSNKIFKGHDMFMSKDTLWVLEESGIYFYRPGEAYLKKLPIDYNEAELDFWNFCRLENGDFLLLTRFDGIYQLDISDLSVTSINHWIEEKYPEALAFRGDDILYDSKGNIWMGWKNYLLVKMPTGQLINLSPAILHKEEILNIKDLSESNSHILVALESGVFRISIDALPEVVIEKVSNQVSDHIEQDKDGNIWSIYHGLYRTMAGQLNPFPFGINDGIHTHGKYGFEQINTIGNKIIVGSRGKYSIFNPSNIKKNTEIPFPYIHSLTINGVQYEPDISLLMKDIIYLNSDENNIKIDFSARAFTKPSSVKFRYRLFNIEKEWNQVGVNQSVVTYSQLNGGNYIFQLQAANDNNIWSEIKSLNIIIDTPLYLQNWFQIIIIILSLTGLIILYLLRISRLKKVAHINNQMLTLEKKALRAQMNPHFIFNALNSIQHLITEGQEQRSIQYLNKFSKLLRGVLSNSREYKTKLSSEIEVIRNYLELELLRLGENFSYEINISNELMNDEVELQGLLFQPIIENAIHHGLAHKKDGGHLRVDIEDRNDHLFCAVEDNGIGRERSGNINYFNGHESTGIKTVASRLSLISGLSADELINIIDLYDENQNPRGTRVEIKIPISSN